MNIVGTLKNARRVAIGEDPRAPCLSGEVYGDTKGRFRDGERITTSTIMEEQGALFRTRFSAYRVESWEGDAANENAAKVERAKPMDLSTLLRDAFLAGRGVVGDSRLTDADVEALVSYDPTRLNSYKRIVGALYGERSA